MRGNNLNCTELYMIMIPLFTGVLVSERQKLNAFLFHYSV